MTKAKQRIKRSVFVECIKCHWLMRGIMRGYQEPARRICYNCCLKGLYKDENEA